MKSTNHNKKSEELKSVFKDEMTFEFAKTLEDFNYVSSFYGSKDWRLVLPLATNRTELSPDYMHFLYKEKTYEN